MNESTQTLAAEIARTQGTAPDATHRAAYATLLAARLDPDTADETTAPAHDCLDPSAYEPEGPADGYRGEWHTNAWAAHDEAAAEHEVGSDAWIAHQLAGDAHRAAEAAAAARLA